MMIMLIVSLQLAMRIGFDLSPVICGYHGYTLTVRNLFTIVQL